MAFVLLTGILVAFLATTLAVAVQRAPTRVKCPECGGATEPVQAPGWLRRSFPSLRGRWCPACAWEGVGRAGPELTPGQPIAHDSGFAWGDERLPEDFGFRFAETPGVEPEAEPPHHPSGFRFAVDPTEDAAHPSGFAWADREGRPPFGVPRTLRFDWAARPDADHFVWRGASSRREKPTPFRWKGVG